jgi:hypothetical protein
MKFAWRRNVTNFAAWNLGLVEKIDSDFYCDMLQSMKQKMIMIRTACGSGRES